MFCVVASCQYECKNGDTYRGFLDETEDNMHPEGRDADRRQGEQAIDASPRRRRAPRRRCAERERPPRPDASVVACEKSQRSGKELLRLIIP